MPAWIEYLKTVDSPTLSNAIELLKIRPRYQGFTPADVRCIFPELGRMCGYAVTAQVETITASDPFDIAQFVDLFRTVERSPKPPVVALQEIGGHPEYAAHCGELMATILTRLGGIGLVSDCAVRDIPEVRALRFHYFARGAVVSHASFRIVRVGIPVQIRGVVIRPGDVLHGDENGLLQVPAVNGEALEEAVNTVRKRERRLMEWVRSERFSLDSLHDFVAD